MGTLITECEVRFARQILIFPLEYRMWFDLRLACAFFFSQKETVFLVLFLLRREDIPVTRTEWFNFIYL